MQLKDNITVSTDKERLNIPMIHDFLCNRSYWAQGRTLDQVNESIKHSICFGVYIGNQQIAFGRVVTDYVVFAWVLDVFVLEEYRGLGVGKKLMKSITQFQNFNKIKKMALATADAHGLYSQFGFSLLQKPENMMERI